MTTWHEKAAALQADGRAFIGGERVWAKSEQQFENLSPIDGRKLGMVARCDGADVDIAVAAARAAFEDGRWAGKSPAQRKRKRSFTVPKVRLKASIQASTRPEPRLMPHRGPFTTA